MRHVAFGASLPLLAAAVAAALAGPRRTACELVLAVAAAMTAAMAAV